MPAVNYPGSNQEQIQSLLIHTASSKLPVGSEQEEVREINTRTVSLVSEMSDSVLHLSSVSESQLESVCPAVVVESVGPLLLPSRQESLISSWIFHRQSECRIWHFCIFSYFFVICKCFMLPENILNLINYVKQIQEQFNYTVTWLCFYTELTLHTLLATSIIFWRPPFHCCVHR